MSADRPDRKAPADPPRDHATAAPSVRPGGSLRPAAPSVRPARRGSGLFAAVSPALLRAPALPSDAVEPRPSGLRPRTAPSLGPPMPPSTDRVFARVATAVGELAGPSSASLDEVLASFANALVDLLPHREVAVFAVHTPERVESARASSANATEAPPERDLWLPDEVAPTALVRLAAADAGDEPGGPREYDIDRDEQVVRAAAPFLVHALRAAAANDALRTQLRQYDRLATLGRFSAELVHELAAPLSSISAHAALVRRASREPAVTERAGRIEDAVVRMRELSRRLLSYARARTEPKGPLSLLEVLEQALLLCEPMLSEVTVERVFTLDAPAIRGDRVELTQVFVNLLANAAQALEGGEGGVVRLLLARDDDGVEVRVEDNGRGIEPRLLGRIFEPFFSTKQPGRGTGLGLSIVRSILDAHGATVHVESEPGRGTAFVVRFPSPARG